MTTFAQLPSDDLDPPATSRAHGRAKAEDVESTRRALARSERLAASELRAVAWRLQRDVAGRERLLRRLAGMS